MTIKEMRDRMHLSQSKFASYMGIPVRTIQSWEQGVRIPPEYVIYMMERILRLEGVITDE